jgi:hypothetical protein
MVACSSSPTSPLEISQLSLGAAYDVFVRGGTAYVSNNQGIAVLDISDLGNPRRAGLISESSSGGTVAGFHVSGDTLFAYGDRFSMYTIGDGPNPQIISSFTGRGFVGGAGMQGHFAYLAFLQGGLEVVDQHDATNPTSVRYVPFTGQVNDLAVHEGFVYVANSSTGLEVFDVGDPTDPVSVGVVAGTPGAWDIHIVRDLLYLGCHRYGVKILDISDPSDPTVLGSYDNGGETYGVFAVGNRLYTVDLQEGVEVLDVTAPSAPSLIMRDRNYHPHDLFSDGQYLYLADQDQHFVVLPLELREIS